MAERGSQRRLVVTGLALAVLAGIALRVSFLSSKPFWRDEAWVASVVELPAPALGGVWHVVPVGFLAAVRGTAALLPGTSPEIAYRLIPLLASIASLGLLPMLAYRVGAPTSAVVSTAWLSAGAPALVYYARELKPYGLDLLWATVLPLIACDVTRRPPDDRGLVRPWLALIVLAASAPWVSYGAVFPTAAVLGWIGWRRIRDTTTWTAAWAPAATTLIVGATFALAYWLYLRRQMAHPWLAPMWDDVLQPPGAPSLHGISRVLADVLRVPLLYVFPGVWPVAALLGLVGLSALPAAGRRLVLWCWLGPASLAAAAALANVYVVARGRFLLFLAPPLIICVAAGLARCCDLAFRRVGPEAGWTSVTVAAAVAVAWGAQSIDRRLRPEAREPKPFVFDVIQDVEPLVTRLDAERVPPSTVLVGRYAADPFRYYSRGRVGGARLMSFRGHAFGDEFRSWLAERDDGWLLLVDEEDGGYRRALEAAAFRIEPTAAARGAAVWRVIREASPPRTRSGSRAGAAVASGSRTQRAAARHGPGE